MIFDTIFPVRDGEAQGAATERKMLSKVGGVNGILTAYQNNPDGSITRMQTRNGHVEFTTTPKKVEAVPAGYVETAYAQRVYTNFPATDGYIFGIKYVTETPLNGGLLLKFNTYPSPAATDTNYTASKILDVEKIFERERVVAKTGKIRTISTAAEFGVDFTETQSSYGVYTTVFPPEDSWTAIRALRPHVVAFKKSGTVEYSAVDLRSPPAAIDTDGLSPLDSIQLVGRPWHGEFIETGLLSLNGVFNDSFNPVLRLPRGDMTVVCFDGNPTVADPTDAESDIGICWGNFVMLTGPNKDLFFGSSESCSLGANGWIYRDSAGKLWEFVFDHSAIPELISTVETTYAVNVLVRPFNTSDAYTVIASITVPVAYETPMPVNDSEFPMVMQDGVCNQTMKGDRAAISILRRGSAVPEYHQVPVAIIEAVVIDNEGDTPGAELSLIVRWDEANSYEGFQTPGPFALSVPHLSTAPASGGGTTYTITFTSENYDALYSTMRPATSIIHETRERYLRTLCAVYSPDGGLLIARIGQDTLTRVAYAANPVSTISYTRTSLYDGGGWTGSLGSDSKTVSSRHFALIGDSESTLCEAFVNSSAAVNGSSATGQFDVFYGDGSGGDQFVVSNRSVSGMEVDYSEIPPEVAQSSSDTCVVTGAVLVSNCAIAGVCRPYSPATHYVTAVATPYGVTPLGYTCDLSAYPTPDMYGQADHPIRSVCANPLTGQVQYSSDTPQWRGFI